MGAGKQVWAVRTDETLDPACCYLSQATREYLGDDKSSFLRPTEEYVVKPNPKGDILTFLVEPISLSKTSFDADQMCCEMATLFDNTAFAAARPVHFVHQNSVFKLIPVKDFIYLHKLHDIFLSSNNSSLFSLSGAAAVESTQLPFSIL